MEVKVKDRQSLLDIAVQTSGSTEAAFELSKANDTSVTETLPDGRILESVAVVNRETARRYKCLCIEPATALSEKDMTLVQEGINFMGIEIDFIVS